MKSTEHSCTEPAITIIGLKATNAAFTPKCIKFDTLLRCQKSLLNGHHICLSGLSKGLKQLLFSVFHNV
jgi:hypothetical protein